MTHCDVGHPLSTWELLNEDRRYPQLHGCKKCLDIVKLAEGIDPKSKSKLYQDMRRDARRVLGLDAA